MDGVVASGEAWLPVAQGNRGVNSQPGASAAPANIRSEFLSAKHSQNVSRDARASGLKRVPRGDVCLSSDPSACALRLTLKPNSHPRACATTANIKTEQPPEGSRHYG